MRRLKWTSYVKSEIGFNVEISRNLLRLSVLIFVIHAVWLECAHTKDGLMLYDRLCWG